MVCNPIEQDERYKHLVGGKVVVPLSGREIPIIADDYVDMEFGTGALKITPGKSRRWVLADSGLVSACPGIVSWFVCLFWPASRASNRKQERVASCLGWFVFCLGC